MTDHLDLAKRLILSDGQKHSPYGGPSLEVVEAQTHALIAVAESLQHFATSLQPAAAELFRGLTEVLGVAPIPDPVVDYAVRQRGAVPPIACHPDIVETLTVECRGQAWRDSNGDIWEYVEDEWGDGWRWRVEIRNGYESPCRYEDGDTDFPVWAPYARIDN